MEVVWEENLEPEGLGMGWRRWRCGCRERSRPAGSSSHAPGRSWSRSNREQGAGGCDRQASGERGRDRKYGSQRAAAGRPGHRLEPGRGVRDRSVARRRPAGWEPAPARGGRTPVPQGHHRPALSDEAW